LRHGFATEALRSGVDLYTISKLLGHEDISTTTIYAHLCPEDAIRELRSKFGTRNQWYSQNMNKMNDLILIIICFIIFIIILGIILMLMRREALQEYDIEISNKKIRNSKQGSKQWVKH